MSVRVVIQCDHLGCKATSGSFETERLLRWYEPLVNSWGRYDRNLRLMMLESEEVKPEDGPDYMDLCPKCCAEIFFMWMYVTVYGNDRMGCAYHIRPHDDPGYDEFHWNYNPDSPAHTAGRNLPHGQVGVHWENDGSGRHILPRFIFPEADRVEPELMTQDEVRSELGLPALTKTRPGEVED